MTTHRNQLFIAYSLSIADPHPPARRPQSCQLVLDKMRTIFCVALLLGLSLCVAYAAEPVPVASAGATTTAPVAAEVGMLLMMHRCSLGQQCSVRTRSMMSCM